jgi:antitoxin (DNA-binding transcriptional repressor) of toxin-antitoxin stability system
MRTVSVTKIARDLAGYVDRVASRGERYTLVDGGKAVAVLSPVRTGVRIEDLPAVLASLPRLTPAEAEAFGRDIEAGRPRPRDDDFGDPWAS